MLEGLNRRKVARVAYRVAGFESKKWLKDKVRGRKLRLNLYLRHAALDLGPFKSVQTHAPNPGYRSSTAEGDGKRNLRRSSGMLTSAPGQCHPEKPIKNLAESTHKPIRRCFR